MSLTVWGVMLGVVVLLGRWLHGRRRSESVALSRWTVSLGGQQALHVVELDGRRLLVGTGPAAAPRLLLELESRSGRARERGGPSGSTGEHARRIDFGPIRDERQDERQDEREKVEPWSS